MTTTSTLVTLCIASTFGFTVTAVLPAQGPTDVVPWKELAGGGSALLLLAALYFFLRFLQQDRIARDNERQQDREHMEKVVGECTAATTNLGSTFAATVKDYREDSQAARRELQDLVRELKRA